MNLSTYLEKHGELENATAALKYFEFRKGVIVNDNVLKAYKVVINNTTSRVGQYSPRKREIELHEGLLVDAVGRKEEHRQTLLHEVAHLIQRHIWDLNGERTTAHGWQWKMVMAKLGIPADRTHKSDWMTEFVANKAKLIYCCKKCGHEINAQKPRRKLLRMGVTHRYCGGSFYLKEDRRSNQPYRYVNHITPAPINTVEAAAAFVGETPRKRVLGTVYIKKAMYRNKRVLPGTYDVVREFKFKKNDWVKGTITILSGGQQIRVTVEHDWFVR